MTDARAEARRRIALAAHRLICSGCTDAECVEMDEADWDVADAVLDLVEISEEWRVEGEDPETAEDEGGGWVMYADDRYHAHRLAAEHGGTPIVTLMLSLPVEPVVPEEPQP